MKSIRHKETGGVVRVSDSEAEEYVMGGDWAYTSKEKFKRVSKLGNVKTVKTTKVKRVKKKKSKRNK